MKNALITQPAEGAPNSLATGSVLPAPAIARPGPVLPTYPPANPTPDDLIQVKAIEESGKVLNDLAAAAYLQAIAGKSFGGLVGDTGFQAYRDQLLRDSGNPADPIERMLIEQLALAHHHLGQLHQRAAQAVSPEAAKVYFGAASRMLAEFRRLALAIRQYRAPVKTRSFTVVKQQNLATEQSIALIEGGDRNLQKDSFSAPSELGSKSRLSDDRSRKVDFYEEPEACACGAPESAQTPRDHGRGRDKLRQNARKHQPWRFSTGPRTVEGKNRARMNGKRRQKDVLSRSETRTLVQELNEMLAGMAEVRQLAVRDADSI